jgi:WD repeat-containing protein 68
MAETPLKPAERTPQDKVTYTTPWTIYGLSFSPNPHHQLRLAVGSFIEDQNNRVDIIELREDRGSLERVLTFDHHYPPTKLMWIPDTTGSRPELLASTSDCLRIWQTGTEVALRAKLANSRQTEYCAPLTSFDWNSMNLNMIGTASIDTTCTIWDLEREQATAQLIAHDKEVYDIAFSQNPHLFASVGADGSVRQFDLRNMEHSKILYESPDYTPLLRLAWNKHDANYLATIIMESSAVTILDVRSPGRPAFKLNGHQNCVNSIAWAPHSSYHLCSAGDDCQALIWDLQSPQGAEKEPCLTYAAEAEINSLQWSPAFTDWVAISFNKSLQMLKV